MNNKVVSALAFCIFANIACDNTRSGLFMQVDANQDGYVGPAEGAELEGLTENWQQFDMDRDGQLDKAEFSKFEVMSTSSQRQRQ